MIAFRSALASFALAVAAVSASAASAPTRYFVDVPGSGVPLTIAAFSSDARADVDVFTNATASDPRAAHGKFSIRADGAPFNAGQTFGTLVVLAQTPEKLITFTFTGVTIDAADPTSAKNERITFEATNYTVKYSNQKPS